MSEVPLLKTLQPFDHSRQLVALNIFLSHRYRGYSRLRTHRPRGPYGRSMLRSVRPA